MLIGIDGNEANIKTRVGVNVYAYELLWGIYRLQQKGLTQHKLIVYLSNQPLSDLPPQTKDFIYKVIPGGGMWIIKKLMPELYKSSPKIDIFFTPSHYVPFFSPVPRVCSIMDLGYLESSGQFKKYDFWQLKYWSAYSMFVSNCIIAISEATRKDIVRHYPFTSKKTNVTYLAYDNKLFNQKINDADVRRIKKKYSIVSEYVLFLSTLKPSKNVEGLIKAFKGVVKDYPHLQLVIAGKKGWLYNSIFSLVSELNMGKSVVFTDYISEEDKPGLIKGAKVFVLPSFWEGFGMDPLNAMACGVPVVVSNAGSLPEVVGEAGVLIDPSQPSTIGEGIKKVLSMDKKSYNKLVESGLRQAKKFSWDKTAKETLQILEGVKR